MREDESTARPPKVPKCLGTLRGKECSRTGSSGRLSTYGPTRTQHPACLPCSKIMYALETFTEVFLSP